MRIPLSKRLNCILIAFVFCIGLAQADPFSDLPADHWAAAAVIALTEKGFLNGISPEHFAGERAMTRYQTALLLSRVLVFLENKQPPSSEEMLGQFKEVLADYQDEIDNAGLELSTLEKETDKLSQRIAESERVEVSGGFENRTMSVKMNAGNLGTGSGIDTTFVLDHLERPYALIPIKGGLSETSRSYLDVKSKLDETWNAGGRIAAYQAIGEPLLALSRGVTPPFFSNPFLGTTSNYNLKGSLDQFFFQNQQETVRAEMGSFNLKEMPDYLYAGVPNLTEDGPDFLPNWGGRFEASMKPYLFISKAYSEFFAGKIGQASSWQTQLFGFSAGLEVLGVGVDLHWMTVQNDPATMASGASGLITVPINQNAGWLDPLLQTPLTVGPQKERVAGVDLGYHRSFQNHPVAFKLSYAKSDYKPNTNSSNNAGGELYDISVRGEAVQNFNIGIDYLSIDPKYNPFVLQFSLPVGLGLSPGNFPWGQWPFITNYPGYFTLQNSVKYPQNRQGAELSSDWKNDKLQLKGEYRWLTQKTPTQLTAFNNDVDIQSIGFYEPLFTASGPRNQIFPRGITQDWNLSADYQLRSPLILEVAMAGGQANRPTLDANNIGMSAVLGHLGVIYSFWDRWKLNVAYHKAYGYGRLLSAPTDVQNNQYQNTGETLGIHYLFAPKNSAFFQVGNLEHRSVITPEFNALQFVTGLDVMW